LAEAAEDVVQSYAEYLRDSDFYQDRTGHLREHTQGKLVASDTNSVTVDLVMDEPYGSYVVRHGFSHFEEIVPELTRELNQTMAGFGKRIARRGG
jgi:hypothetical protein